MTSSVLLTLDTRPPTIKVVVGSSVEPPDDLVVTVTSDEAVGVASLALVDALGRVFNLGYERLSDTTLRSRIGTLDLASGTATLRVRVADETLNFTEVTVGIMVRRPRAYDVELTLGGAYALDFARDGAYEVVFTTEPAHHSDLEVS